MQSVLYINSQRSGGRCGLIALAADLKQKQNKLERLLLENINSKHLLIENLGYLKKISYSMSILKETIPEAEGHLKLIEECEQLVQKVKKLNEELLSLLGKAV